MLSKLFGNDIEKPLISAASCYIFAQKKEAPISGGRREIYEKEREHA
jgi:hypothetical protein